MCLTLGYVSRGNTKDIVCYKIFRKRKSLLGKPRFCSLYEYLPKTKMYRIGVKYTAKLQNGGVKEWEKRINGHYVSCEKYVENTWNFQGNTIEMVRGGVFHAYNDMNAAMRAYERESSDPFFSRDELVLTECIIPSGSKVVINGSPIYRESDIVCGSSIIINKIIQE